MSVIPYLYSDDSSSISLQQLNLKGIDGVVTNYPASSNAVFNLLGSQSDIFMPPMGPLAGAFGIVSVFVQFSLILLI